MNWEDIDATAAHKRKAGDLIQRSDLLLSIENWEFWRKRAVQNKHVSRVNCEELQIFALHFIDLN